jgi:hypothetical protein
LDRAILAALKKTASLRTPSVGAFADQVGHAYGLEGEHTGWATTPEEELDRVVSQKLEHVMSAPAPAKKSGDSPADSFFGEDDSLGAAMDGAFAPAGGPASLGGGAGPRSVTAPMSARGDESLGPAGLPTGRIGWWIVPVVVVVAVLLGVLIARLI